MARIGELSRDLDENDAFVIFPEGGNFTAHRRKRAIERLRRKGHIGEAEKAEQLRHVMAPKPGGVLAALTQARDADVVFVAHTGVEHMVTVARRVARAADGPRDPDALVGRPGRRGAARARTSASTGCSRGGPGSTTGSTSARPRPASSPRDEARRAW